MIIAHRDLNAFERSLEQGCALHGRVIRRKAGGYEVLINGSKAFLPNACVLKSEDAPLPRKYLGWFVVQTLASPDDLLNGRLKVVKEVSKSSECVPAMPPEAELAPASPTEVSEASSPARTDWRKGWATAISPLLSTPSHSTAPNPSIKAKPGSLLARLNMLLSAYGISDPMEANELRLLVQDLGTKNFASSGDLSFYIRSHHLQTRYPHIAGRVKFRNSWDASREWTMDGGFSTQIYKIICQTLGLTGRGSDAVAVDFRSESELSAVWPA